jgi:hypothetical protein
VQYSCHRSSNVPSFREIRMDRGRRRRPSWRKHFAFHRQEQLDENCMSYRRYLRVSHNSSQQGTTFPSGLPAGEWPTKHYGVECYAHAKGFLNSSIPMLSLLSESDEKWEHRLETVHKSSSLIVKSPRCQRKNTSTATREACSTLRQFCWAGVVLRLASYSTSKWSSFQVGQTSGCG